MNRSASFPPDPAVPKNAQNTGDLRGKLYVQNDPEAEKLTMDDFPGPTKRGKAALMDLLESNRLQIEEGAPHHPPTAE